MAHVSFEKDLGYLKWWCAGCCYELQFAGMDECAMCCAVRILLKDDRRIFTPLTRTRYAWERPYRKNAAVEQVNSLQGVSIGFEHHFILALAKMRIRLALALRVMLTMVAGRVKEKQQELLRSLVKMAA